MKVKFTDRQQSLAQEFSRINAEAPQMNHFKCGLVAQSERGKKLLANLVDVYWGAGMPSEAFAGLNDIDVMAYNKEVGVIAFPSKMVRDTALDLIERNHLVLGSVKRYDMKLRQP